MPTNDGKTEGGEGVAFENVAAGTYDLVVKRPGRLTWTVKSIAVGAENMDTGTITH